MPLTACLAVVPAALLASNLPPSATFLNQAAAVSGWGLFCAALVWGLTLAPPVAPVRWSGGLKALFAALILLISACAGSWALTGLPPSLALSAIGLLAAAGLVAGVGAAAMSAGCGVAAFRALCIALVTAGLLSVAVGAVQVFAPQWADGQWIAISSLEGRAAGNLRQPNHLSSVLLWSIVALLWLADSTDAGRLSARSGRRFLLVFAALLSLVFGLVLSASRTGMLGVLALAVWGALDRSLSRRTRTLLCLSPLIYALCWLGLTAWADASGHVFGGAARLRSEADISSSRFGIWADTLSLIAQRPWFGVGWGEFNLAWSLTPFPDRPGAFFDHTHNLPLQLAVELGLPLALIVTLLLLWALGRAWPAARGRVADVDSQPTALLRSAWMVVLLVAWHSLLEYPLWYAYFLLPAAFAWGLCLGAAPRAARATALASTARRPAVPLLLASLAMTAGGAASVVDYLRVVAIFEPADAAPPLAERIEVGRRSALFSHHADYAAATTSASPAEVLRAVDGAKHFLLDTRLMMAWAQALADRGDVERARHIAARLREFRNPASKAFFAPCDGSLPPPSPLPFQCTPPSRVMDDRDVR